MTTPDAAALVARLAPGEAEGAFAAALRKYRIGDLRDASRASAYREETRWRIELDRFSRIQSISYWAGFPSDIDIGGVKIGMSADELAALMPSMRTLATDPESDGAYVLLPSAAPAVMRGYLRKGRLTILEVAGEAIEVTPLLSRMDERVARRRARARPVTADADMRLSYWVEDARMLTFNRAVLPRFAVWLYGASPDERHDVARHWNWDNGTVPLYWIIHQPDCDLATAVLIHQMAQPAYYRDFAGNRSRVPEHALDGFDLIVAIRRRIADGLYRRREIGIEHKLDDIGTGDGLVVVPRTGRNPPSAANDEGVPRHLFLQREGGE